MHPVELYFHYFVKIAFSPVYWLILWGGWVLLGTDGLIGMLLMGMVLWVAAPFVDLDV